VLGIGILLLSQATVNMLVCTGVFPVTGQNMPLLAMGGSALIMTCVGIGIVQSIATRQQTQEEKTDEKEKEIQNAFVG
jgi:cell division protein FtsW